MNPESSRTDVVVIYGVFRAKWNPVRVKKTRQNKIMEPASDLIRSGKALAAFRLAIRSGCLLQNLAQRVKAVCLAR